MSTMVRAHVLLPKVLVEKIDVVVGPRKRSEYIASLIEADLDRKERVAMLEQAIEGLRDSGPNEWDAYPSSVDWVRSVREQGRDHWADFRARERERERAIE